MQKQELKSTVYIFGAFGQDGHYLSKILKETKIINFRTLILVGSKAYIVLEGHHASIHKRSKNTSGIVDLIKDLFNHYPPSDIFYLAAKHYSSLDKVDILTNEEMKYVNCEMPIEILSESIRMGYKPRLLYASSSLVFAGSHRDLLDEESERFPLCKYAEQKIDAANMLKKLSNNNGIRFFEAILFNHESVRRKKKFFTKKVINYLVEYAFENITDPLVLFNKYGVIDMSYAPEFCRAFIDLMASDKAGTYIFSSSNQAITIAEFVDCAIKYIGATNAPIIYKESELLTRKPLRLIGNNKKLIDTIGYHSEYVGTNLVKKLVDDYILETLAL